MNLQAKQLKQEWEINPRWKNVRRTYSAEDVIRLRGSIQLEYTLAKRGAEKLWQLIYGNNSKKGYVNCMGALTAGQAMQQAKAGLEAVYLSGWQVAADANSSEQMYPSISLCLICLQTNTFPSQIFILSYFIVYICSFFVGVQKVFSG